MALVPRIRLVVLGLCLLSSSFARSQDLAIYSDSLQNNWQDWSWNSTLNFGNTDPVHTGLKSVAVTIDVAWGALYLHHAPISTGLYKDLTFWIHGGSVGGQMLQVAGLRNGQQAGVSNIGPLTANSWQKFTLPLSSLGVANVSDFDGFWLQDQTGKAQPTWYIDDAKLTYSAPSTAKITIDAIDVLRKVDSRHFGVNAAVWDSAFSHPETVQYLAAAGTKIMRFPGGSLSDTYHWATGRSDGNNWSWVTNFDHFATAAKAIGSQAYITVNYGSGTPQEAADWVRYSNVTKRYGFKYWEIGNENYGTWENDTNTRPHDPVTYATRAKEFIALMKAVDPTIKIGVVAVTGEDSFANYNDLSVVNPRTGITYKGWTPVMLSKLKQLGVTPDYLIYHRYPQGPFNESDSWLLQSSDTWANDAADLRQQLRDYLGVASNKVEIVCTENNSVYTQPGKQTTSLVNGLFYADSLGQLMKTEFNALVWWDLRNGKDTANNNSASLYGWREYGDYGFLSGTSERYPPYFALKLYKFYARAGDYVLNAASDNPLLAVYAARRLNGTLSILVINKSPSLNLSGEFTILNYTTPASATSYKYGIAQDNAARDGVGSVDLKKGTLATGQTFTANFSPYSMTVITMAGTPPPAAPTAPSGLTAAAVSSSRIDMSWSDNSLDETSFLIERSPDLIYWTQIASVGTNTKTYSNTGLTRNTVYHYRVRARGPGGLSSYSNVAKARTLG